MTWADGAAGLNHEQLLLTWSRNRGSTWTAPSVVPLPAGDRPVYTAPAAAPDGSDLYVVANAFTTPYRNDTSSVRGLVGEVLHAEVTAGTPGGWSSLHRGAVGDPRGTSQNGLTAEFLGDYVYAAATRDGVVGVWNEDRGRRRLPGYRRLPRVAVHQQPLGSAQRAGRLPGGLREQRHPGRRLRGPDALSGAGSAATGRWSTVPTICRFLGTSRGLHTGCREGLPTGRGTHLPGTHTLR